MLVLIRQVGEAVLIENLELRVTRITESQVEVTIGNSDTPNSNVLTLSRHQPVDVCCDVQVVLISIKEEKARLGFAYPKRIVIKSV